MAVKNWQLEAQVWKDSGKGHGGLGISDFTQKSKEGSWGTPLSAE